MQIESPLPLNLSLKPKPQQELNFLLAVCTQSEFEASENIDFDELLHLSRRHRLVGTLNKAVFKSKEKFPEIFVEKLSRNAQNIAFRNLQLCQQLILLGNRFGEEKIEWISLKGPALAQYIFRELSLRQSSDLDILVQQGDLARTDKLLTEIGFEDTSETPFAQLNDSEKKAFSQISHELPYFNSKTRVKVELHWKLVAPKSLFPKNESEIWKSIKPVQLGGVEIPTLSDENQLLYLCTHGAKHQWFRLFWLRDIFYLLQKVDFDLDNILRELHNNGNHRSLLSGLCLCHEFFGYKLTELTKSIGKEDKTFQMVLQRSRESILSDESASAPGVEENIWGITKNLMQLKSGWRYKLECLHRFRTSPQDWERLKLPKKWFFLYYFARPFMAISRRVFFCEKS